MTSRPLEDNGLRPAGSQVRAGPKSLANCAEYARRLKGFQWGFQQHAGREEDK